MDSRALDAANARFWDELCGTSFARRLGISDHSSESLHKFDRAYLDMYPYLLERVPVARMRARSVLEVGLGYGTLGQKIAEAGVDYTGLDVAQGPVDMMNHRLRMRGLPGGAIRGSMLDCPLPDASVDCVVSIGCFHHTGDVARCIDETWRVLKPGGEAFIMVYNRFSYRQWIRWPLVTAHAALAGPREPASDAQRRAYDPNVAGAAAPETVFVSISELRRLLARFSSVGIRRENCDHVTVRGRALVPRKLLLSTIGRLAGLDLYAHAGK